MVPNTARNRTVCHHYCGCLVIYDCKNILNAPSWAKKGYFSAKSQVVACYHPFLHLEMHRSHVFS